MSKSAPRWGCLAIVGALLSFPLLANAAGGSGISWTIQDTGISDGSSSYGTVLGMRDGKAWPVIFTNYGNAYTLFPIGNSSSTPYKQIGSYLFGNGSSSSYGLRASTSLNGQIVVTRRDFSSTSSYPNGTITSTTAGFNSLAMNVVTAAFDKNGNLITVTRGSSSQSISSIGLISSSIISSNIIDIAVSPFNAIGVISSGSFTEYTPWYGWLPSSSLSNLGSSSDLTYDTKGRPHVVTMGGVSSNGYSVLAHDFDTISGKWVTTTLGTAYSNSSNTALSIVSNDQGTVGTAFVDYAGNLVYAYKEDGSTTWSKSLITSGLSSYLGQQVGIEYDYAGLPVISYTNSSGYISLAYDPIVIPEPATFSLLAIAATVTLLRRRSA